MIGSTEVKRVVLTGCERLKNRRVKARSNCVVRACVNRLWGPTDWAREMELNMRMVCETEINPKSKTGEVVEEVTVEAFAELEIAAGLPGMLRNMPGSQGIGNAILDTILLAIEVGGMAAS